MAGRLFPSVIWSIKNVVLGLSALATGAKATQGTNARLHAAPTGRVVHCAIRPQNHPVAHYGAAHAASGADPRVHAVYANDLDIVWATEWSSNALLCFDPGSEKFSVISLPRPAAGSRELRGRQWEGWLPESGTGFIAVRRTG